LPPQTVFSTCSHPDYPSRGAQAIFRAKPFLNRTHTSDYSPKKMEQTKCSETLAFKLQTPGNNPEESKRHSKHGKSLKSRITLILLYKLYLTMYCETSDTCISCFTLLSNNSVRCMYSLQTEEFPDILH
jgi:hypothetical protein